MRDDIGEYVAKLEKEIIGFKSTQSISSRSIKVFKSETGNIWDASWTRPTAFVTNEVVFFRFVPDNQDAPFVSIQLKAELNGVEFNPDANDFVIANIFEGTGSSIVSLRSTPYYFGVSLEGGSSIGDTTRVKITILATDTGHIERVTP